MHNIISKIATVEQALESVSDGTHLMYGGFGGIGTPATLIEGILQKGVQELTLTGNDAGYPDLGVGRLISHSRVKRLQTTHIGSNPVASRQMMEGRLAVEFYPQGVLAEKIRAGGVGIAGILVDVGLEGVDRTWKQQVIVAGRTYWIEPAITADVGIVYARVADTFGNLIYEKGARNLNPLVAMAADVTIAEVEEIVPVGDIDPERIVTPGIFVDYIVKSDGVKRQWG